MGFPSTQKDTPQGGNLRRHLRCYLRPPASLSGSAGVRHGCTRAIKHRRRGSCRHPSSRRRWRPGRLRGRGPRPGWGPPAPPGGSGGGGPIRSNRLFSCYDADAVSDIDGRRLSKHHHRPVLRGTHGVYSFTCQVLYSPYGIAFLDAVENIHLRDEVTALLHGQGGGVVVAVSDEVALRRFVVDFAVEDSELFEDVCETSCI